MYNFMIHHLYLALCAHHLKLNLLPSPYIWPPFTTYYSLTPVSLVTTLLGGYCLSPYTKINTKWIEDLNIRPETLNCTEENIGTKLVDLGLIKDFISLTSKTREVKAKINEWDYIKLKRNCQQNKKATTEWRRYL